MAESTNKPLHRIREVRRREGISVRTLARHLHQSTTVVKRLDEPTTDMRLSDVLMIAEAMHVPAAELVGDVEHTEVQRLMSLMVRIAKATNTLLGKLKQPGTRRVAEYIKAQLNEAVPVDECGELPRVGLRRTLDDFGRAALNPVSTAHLADDFLNEGER